MGIQYTKKEKRNAADERTVPAEEFVNLMVSMKRMPDRKTELPKTEIKK